MRMEILTHMKIIVFILQTRFIPFPYLIVKKRWEDNIKEWTGMDFASSTRAAGKRTKWKGIVANLSVVPRRPSKVTG